MTTSDTNDKIYFNKIIDGIKKDAEKGLERFYNDYGRMIKITANSIVKSPALTDEVVNDVLKKMWDLSKTIYDIEKPYSYIYVITANCARDKIKKKERCTELTSNIPDTNNEIKEFIDRDTFYSMISGLNKQEQSIVINKIIWGFTFQEIADENEMPASTLSAKYYRLLEKVKNKLKKF